MGCNDGFDDAHMAEIRRDGEAQRIRERLGPIRMSELTLDESRILHRERLKLDDKELAILKAAERRIFGAKGRQVQPYVPMYTPGRNHI